MRFNKKLSWACAMAIAMLINAGYTNARAVTASFPPLKARAFIVGAQPYHHVGLHTAFNIDDIFIGLNGGYNLSKKLDLAVVGSFEMRPTAKRVLVEHAPNFYYQLQQRRFLPAVGLEKRFELHEILDIFVGASVGYLLGDFKGTRMDTEDGLVFMPRAGLSFKPGRNGLISIGYQYQSIYDSAIEPHRVYIACAVRWGRNK